MQTTIRTNGTSRFVRTYRYTLVLYVYLYERGMGKGGSGVSEETNVTVSISHRYILWQSIFISPGSVIQQKRSEWIPKCFSFWFTQLFSIDIHLFLCYASFYLCLFNFFLFFSLPQFFLSCRFASVSYSCSTTVEKVSIFPIYVPFQFFLQHP